MAPWWFLHRAHQPFQHPNTPNIPSDTTLSDATITPTVGDFIDHLGLTFYWSKEHRTAQQLDQLRTIGDDLADEALVAMQLGASDDPMKQLNQPNQPIPVQALHKQLTSVPSWVDWDQIKRGQEVFVRYAGGSGLTLLHCSLVGGFGAPKINKVLGSTGYLSRSCHTTYVRLFETLQMIVDCTETDGLLPTTGVGWQACVRVRMLHAKVRKHLLAMEKWQRKEWGVPINQEDMGATLLSFQIIVLECLDYMNFNLSLQEQHDYTALWRLIGYYSGVEEQYNPCSSYSYSRATLESITRHIVTPDDTSSQMSNHMLRAVANKPPLHLSYESGAQLSRMLLGDVGADRLKLPKEHWWWHVFHGMHFMLLRWVANMTRMPLVGRGMMETQRMVLRRAAKTFQGGKRTKYFLKHPPDDRHFEDLGVDDGTAGGAGGPPNQKGRGITGNALFLMCGKGKGMHVAMFVLLVGLLWKMWAWVLS